MKKLISLLMVIALLAGMIAALPFTSSATVHIKGDVDNDGLITIRDSLFMKKYLACIIDFDTDELTAADLNGDTVVSSKDVRLLMCYLVCIINSVLRNNCT